MGRAGFWCKVTNTGLNFGSKPKIAHDVFHEYCVKQRASKSTSPIHNGTRMITYRSKAATHFLVNDNIGAIARHVFGLVVMRL